ncbi:hypothetical protein RvY_03259 [Ramazzottius varieornatus]|uniref:UBC core domain-containing protein n=1 Tax=Ramazzottius varieornatus TaxID=947166 RepID=A0A1D1UR78_RAMVA|nr:hypothetical protein RvY_03259 [Ramazzottius varieornatus]
MSACEEAAQDIEETLLKKLPYDPQWYDVWRTVFSFVANDDATLFSLLEASTSFRAFFRRDVLERVDSSPYWRDALVKRGVRISTLSSLSSQEDSPSLTWFDRYRQYAKSMGCYRCFWRLSSGQPVNPSAFYRSDVGERDITNDSGSHQNPGHFSKGPPPSADVGDWKVARFCERQTDFAYLIVTIIGPPDTPYVGGRFQLLIVFPENYPAEPPQAKLLTKIVSPYFTDHGDFYCKYTNFDDAADYETFLGYPPYWHTMYFVDLVQQYLSFSFCQDAPPGLIAVHKQHTELVKSNRAEFAQLARKCTLENAMIHWNISCEDFCSTRSSSIDRAARHKTKFLKCQ